MKQAGMMMISKNNQSQAGNQQRIQTLTQELQISNYQI